MLLNKKDDIDEDDKTEEFVNFFYDHSNKTIKFVGEKILSINVKYNELSKYFGLKNMDIEKFVLIMKEFYIKTSKIIENESKNIINNIIINKKNEEKIINIIFISIDQKIKFPISCKDSIKFYIIEDLLYNRYPEYNEKENYFLVNGKKVNRFKSLQENDIKNGDNILLNTLE